MHRRSVPLAGAKEVEAEMDRKSRGDTRKTRRTARKRKASKKYWKQDLLVLLIQLLSYLILVSCTVLLVAKWIFGYNMLSPSTNSKDPVEYKPMDYDSNEERIAKEFHVLKPSTVYQIPDAMPHIGDKTDAYAQLRKEFDAKDLPDVKQKLTFDPMVMEHVNSDQVPYDIFDCPETPPDGYPFDWTLLDVLKEWPPDDPTPRTKLFQGVCVFDYAKDLQKAYNYREMEVPFIVKNDPEVQTAVKRWNYPGYMERMLRDVKHRAEYSENNHFLYWNQPGKKKRKINNNNPNQQPNRTPEDWKAPTKNLRITYSDWLEHANVTDDSQLGPDMPHWYFRLIGCGETGPEGTCDAGSSEYLFDELPFFQPKPSLYMVDYAQQKGIHCRFGMKGVIAENHFDGSRNAIVVLGGERRYILSHPDQCKFLSLLPKGHPSARHSAVDWSNPDLVQFPEFQLAKGNEVVLQAGDVLYLPTDWFHFIISLDLNFQCNTRSGINTKYAPPIHECGF